MLNRFGFSTILLTFGAIIPGVITPPASGAATINIAFHNGSVTVDAFNTRPDGTVVSAGTNGSDTWNNVQNNGGVGLSFNNFALDLADGSASGATMDVNSGFATFNNNGWGTQSDDYVMMEGWYGFRDSESIIINGLPSAFTGPGYTVTIYGDSNKPQNNDPRTMDYFIGVVQKTLFDDAEFSGTFIESGGAGDNFVVFDGLSGSSFTVTGNTTSSGRSAVNGIVIRAIPEPATLALVGLAGLCLLSRRHPSREQ